jgi:hypothetical protein
MKASALKKSTPTLATSDTLSAFMRFLEARLCGRLGLHFLCFQVETDGQPEEMEKCEVLASTPHRPILNCGDLHKVIVNRFSPIGRLFTLDIFEKYFCGQCHNFSSKRINNAFY